METLFVLAAFSLTLLFHTHKVQGSDCPEKLDIAIIADTSRSMKRKQRETLNNLVGKLIDKYPVSAEGNHYSFMTFNRFATIQNVFNMQEYYNEEALKNLISAKVKFFPDKWGTRSDIALHKAATELFTSDGGDRPDGKNVLLVFTDGLQVKFNNDRQPEESYSESTKTLEDKGVSITVVGILGENWKKHEYRLKMKEMAGNKGQVLMYPDFETLTESYDEVLATLCPVDGGYTEWTISACSKTCGPGYKTFERTCTNPPPSNGGKNCDDLGTAMKLVPCNEQECHYCPTRKMDIAILADTSLSMTPTQRRTLNNLINQLIDKYPVSAEGNHYGFITFNRYAKIQSDFNTQPYYDQQALKNLIEKEVNSVPGPKQWGTRSDIALHKAATKLFTSDGGDRPDAINVLLVFTDGLQFITREDKKKLPFKSFSKSTRTLEEKGVSITVVGIFGKKWKDLDVRQKMEKMAGNKGQVNMFPDFETLATHFDEVLAVLCPVDGGYTAWTISPCSETCGPGYKTFARTCTNPPPSNGGKNCDELGTAMKLVPCNEQECQPACSAGLDIGIVLDKSMSIRKKDIKKVIEFLKGLVKKFNPAADKDHFGLITFNKQANLVFDFANSDYYNMNQLLNKISREPKTRKWGTRTDLAMEMARDKLFTVAGGDRSDKPNVLLVLTDGRPYGLPKNKNFEEFSKNIAEDFKRKDVFVIAVGFGKKIDKGTLQAIAGEGKPVFQAKDTSQLEGMISTIKSLTCSDTIKVPPIQ